MNNRIEIAQKFSKAINSDKIIKIILFGSVARGYDTEDSDIDILIISDYQKEIQDKITFESFQIVLNNQEVITPIIMSTDKMNQINDFTFMKNVRREGIVLG
ncbi:MAG: nucleotidyltransferase domain-containing protein [Methanosphaera stadtmanae]|nr:nucleotidyltransferase domain-containing protein [Methanosphaera stadtmanae]